jgi:hypothetical protein
MAIWPFEASEISLTPMELRSARSSERICALSSTISALRFSKPGPDILSFALGLTSFRSQEIAEIPDIYNSFALSYPAGSY